MGNILDKKDKSIVPNPVRGGTPKEEKWKWARPSSPGTYRQINKSELNIDDRYQRDEQSRDRVMRIARDWDWSLFEVLMVAERSDGTFWVFSGGHRVRASFYRSDIQALPCLVFSMNDVADEARAFIAVRKMSSSIKALDTYRACVCSSGASSIGS